MGKWKNICFSCGVCLLFSLSIVKAQCQQNGGIFYRLTTQNGLSSDKINDIIQDREGYYWIATGDGLNRFDGSSCKVWRNVRNDTNSISHNCCIKLLEDIEGNIWITTLRGLNRYIKNEGRFQRFYFKHPTINFDRVNSLKGLATDKYGNIWVSSYGLWKYDMASGKWSSFIHNPAEPASAPEGSLAFLAYDEPDKGLWMSGRDSYVFFDIKSEKFFYSAYNKSNLPIFSIKSYQQSIVLDHRNNIWSYDEDRKRLFGYNLNTKKIVYADFKISKGISRISIDGDDRIWIHHWNSPTWIYDQDKNELDSTFLDPAHESSTLTNVSTNQFTDKSGNIWIASDRGISIFDPSVQSIKYMTILGGRKTYEGSEMQITSIQCALINDLWIGTNAGLYHFDVASGTLKWINKIRIHNDLIRSLFLQDDSVLWIGGHGQLIRYNIISDRILQRIRLPSVCWALKEDNKQNIWAATWDKGLFKFTHSGQLVCHIQQSMDSLRNPPSNNILCMAFTEKPFGLWMGFNGGAGFSKMNFKDSLYHNFKIPSRHPFFNISNTVNCISPDKNGNLWMGTYGGGVVFFDCNNRTFHQYTQSDGLRGNFINSLVQDDNDRLWISTSNGISILDKRSGRLNQPDFDLSFTNNDVVPNCLKLKNHNLLFFSGNKIIEINPAKYLGTSSSSKILLSSFKVFDKEIQKPEMNSEKRPMRLAFNDNFFSVDYSLLKPNPNSSTQYAYKLSGFDKEWNYVNKRRTAFYTNVPPGEYMFLVKATDAAGNWVFSSDPLFLAVSPPFWRTWWFITSLCLLALTGFFYLYRYRINQLKKLYSLRSKISHDLHDEVASTLSGIKLYGELAKNQLRENETEKVLRSLEIISSNASEMKEDMSDIVWAVNPANDSLAKLLKKLKRYATEITEAAGISFTLSANEKIGDEKLNMQETRNIYLICKEAINNAVKYSGATHLDLKILKEDHVMQININDNGIGFDTHASPKGNGLLNMKIRAGEIDSLLQINSVQGKGTQVGIKVKM